MEESNSTTPTLRDGNVEIWIEEIGPARAEQLLKTYSTDYRKYRPTYAEGLARDQANGHWLFDGSPIRIDEEGNLFDGQHRLNAVAMSNTLQKFLVVSGLPVKAYDTTDTGLARNYGDTLRRRGYRNVLPRQALVKGIARWDAHRSFDDTKRLTSSEQDEVHDKFVDSISRVLELALTTPRTVELRFSLLALAWWILRQIDEEKSMTFMTSLSEGTGMMRGNPIYALFQKLHTLRDTKLKKCEYMHLVFYAWNAWLIKKPLQIIPLPNNISFDNMAMPMTMEEAERFLKVEEEKEAKRNKEQDQEV